MLVYTNGSRLPSAHNCRALQMTYVQATQGGGGWPMSVFLTPSLQPFVAGTYFPPQDMYGRPGFKTLLRRITAAWQSKKEDIKAQSADSMDQLASMTILEGAAHLATFCLHAHNVA